MSLKPLAAIVVIFGCASSAAAQPRLELFGYAGYGRVTEDEGHLGAGPELGGGLRWFVTSRTYIPVQVMHQRVLRDTTLQIGFRDTRMPGASLTFLPVEFRRRDGATFFTLGIGHLFADGPVAPFVEGEFGFMHYSSPGTKVDTASIPPYLAPQVPLVGLPRSTDAMSAAFNAGVRVRIGDRWTVGPQAALRLANTGEFGPKYMLRFGAATGVRW